MKIKLVISFLALSVVMYSCKTASYYFNKAEKQYAQGEFAFAIENYKQAEGKGADAVECNYKIAESLRQTNQLAESAPYYKKVIDAGTIHEKSYYYYGLALKNLGKYYDASQFLKNYTKTGSNRAIMKRAKLEYQKIDQIDNIPDSRTKYKIENFTAINSEGDDYGVAFMGNKLVFASIRGESKTYAGTGSGFSDLYTFTYDDATTKATGFVKKFDENNINLDYTHEAEPTFSSDGSIMVFARSNDGSKKGDKDVMLYMSKLQPDGNWSLPTKLSINDPEAWNGCPKFSNDGKTLYFASNRDKGRGGIDLYSAEYKDGQFLHVKNLGSNINTYGNEMFPYEGEDGFLYFASDVHVSYGGLDIFKTEKDENGKFTKEIINLGKTINTPFDEFGIIFENKQNGFFTSNRPNGKGGDDIYKFKVVVEPYYFLEAIVKGVSRDTTLLIEKAKLTLKLGDSVITEDFTDSIGEFHLKIEKDKKYTLLAQKDNYFTGTLDFIVDDKLIATLTKNEDGDYVVPEIINLEKIEVVKEGEKMPTYSLTKFNINDIYYDLGKSEIRPDAAVELEKVIIFLNSNPGISIELSSHTDSRDTDENNLALSQKRAEAAVNYIIGKGISESRIVAKGYGESKLLNKCADNVDCTEEEHQANRRTEIAVTQVLNTIEQQRKEYEKLKLEEELERKRLEELQNEIQEEEDEKQQEESKEKDAEYQEYLKMKQKMEEMEKKYKNDKE